MNDLAIQIPAAVIYSTIGIGLLAALGWAFAHERRIGNIRGDMLTRAEHDAICAANQAEVKATLEAISSKLDEQDRRSQSHREEMAATLGRISTEVANIKEQMKSSAPILVDTNVTTRVRRGPRRK